MKFNKLKTLTFKVLDLLPNQFGYFIYHKLQERSFKNIEPKITANKNSYTVINKILKKNNIDLNNQNIVEIGSGWFPIMPYLFKINARVETVYTYDINQHYSNKRIRMVNNYFNNNKDIHFKLVEYNQFWLPDFTKYIPKQNIASANLPKNVKLYFSRFVLEHVNPHEIEQIHQKLFNEMENDAVILHLISPSDHRAYSDGSLSYYDFLKYSEAEWNRIQTKFDYHNRLRLPQYIEIFKRIGFEMAYLEHDKVPKDSKKYKQFKKLNIHPDYKKFSEADILAGSINMLLRKP